MDKCTYEFDIHEKKIVQDCSLHPSSEKSKTLWLHAMNNKYADEDLDVEKLGKWTIFVPKNKINAIWKKVKVGVSNNELWRAKVCTKPGERGDAHALFIYSSDYTDLDDVTRVLEYLENSGIKPADLNIKYSKTKGSSKADNPGGKATVLYSSDKIRSAGRFTYHFDIHKKEVVTDCTAYPTQVAEKTDWLYANNNKYPQKSIDRAKVGKWMLFLPKNSVNKAWDKIKVAVAKGELWSAQVATKVEKKSTDHALFIYTVDHTDLNDVISTLAYLEKKGLKPPNQVIKYKTKQQTHAKAKQSIYSSNAVRNLAPAQPKDDSVRDTYEFDVHKKELVTDCKSYPTEAAKISPWLTAKNNKYTEEEVDAEKIGKWMLYVPKKGVNGMWDKIKTAVANGELWLVKVATKPETSSFRGSYAVSVYTKDYSDRSDIISVLDYLESSGIKPASAVFKYKMEQQTVLGVDNGGKARSLLYSSDTLRSTVP